MHGNGGINTHKQMKYPIFKYFLTKFGVFVPARSIHYANGLLNYLSLGRWFRDQGINVPARVTGRLELYTLVASQLTEPVSYVEFGVFKGTTLGWWTQLLKSPASKLTGFDSFEGLPENWGYFTDKTKFYVHGNIPQFNDPRVQLVKGWFDQTLPPFLKIFQPHPTLVVHLDADLYSSTIFVLRQIKPHLRVGTVLIFDEFFDREHEMKALSEFLGEVPLKLECLAATKSLSQVAFRIVSAP